MRRHLGAVAALAAVLSPLPALARTPDFTAFDKAVKAQCASGEFGGIVTVAVAGEPVYSHSCGGPFAPNARFKIFSISKLLTALAVMKLVEEGRMSLDAPVVTYVPDLPPLWRAVTVRQLLTHTSGIHDHSDEFMENFRTDHASAMRGFLKRRDVRKATPRRGPGSGYRYNNFGYELLADAAARVSGESFDKVLTRRVLRPAGMKDAVVELGQGKGWRKSETFISVPDPRLVKGWNREFDGKRDQTVEAVSYSFIQLGAGAIHASMADMLALDRAIADNRVVSARTWSMMLDQKIAMSAANPGAFYGLGVMVGDREGLPSHGHTGGVNGYISTFRRFPTRDGVVIALSNTGWAGTRWIETGAAAALAGS